SPDCDTSGLTMPIVEVGRGDGGACSITGGVVYRGSEIPELDGRFLFSDFCGGFLRSTDGEGQVEDHTDDVGVPGEVVSFGVDGAGEVYVLTAGEVLAVRPVRWASQILAEADAVGRVHVLAPARDGDEPERLVQPAGLGLARAHLEDESCRPSVSRLRLETGQDRPSETDAA